MTFWSLTLTLFLIMDPVGNLTSYRTLIQGIPKQQQNKIIFREMLISLLIMIGFYYLGGVLLDFLHLTQTSLTLSSGILLFLIAIKILFTQQDSLRAHLPGGEPFIFPIAVPLIAGPSLLATILLFAKLESTQTVLLTAILAAWTISVMIFFFSEKIQKVVGENGLKAAERLIGMILVLIAVQRFLEGVSLFWTTRPISSL